MRKRMTKARPSGKRQSRKASTTDILLPGHPPQRPQKVPKKWARHYKRLIELRSYLLNESSALARDAREEAAQFSQHMADAGTDSYDRDLALGMLSSEQDAVYQIDQALDRIRNGTYGRCEMTGKPISSARLAAVPWTRFSAAAEKQVEKEGAFSKTRLGARERLSRGDNSREPEDDQR